MKKNVILLHGALGNHQDLMELSLFLREKGYEVFNFDFYGHGKNHAGAPFTILSLAQNLLITLNQLGPSHIFSYSMGGYVALYAIAILKTKKILSVTTYGTKFDWSEEICNKEVRKLDFNFLKVKAPAFLASLDQKHEGKAEALLLETANMMRKLSLEHQISDNDFKNISIPITLLRGDEDKMVTIHETKQVAQLIPSVKFINIPKARHELSSLSMEDLCSSFLF